MAELPLHVSVLQRLHKETTEQREAIKERMAKGVPGDTYVGLVGETKTLKAVCDRIETMLKQLRTTELEDFEDDADERDSDAPPPERALARARQAERQRAADA